MAVNTMPVSAGDALNVLKAMWDSGLARKIATMMHGEPGIGKTQIAESLARYIGGPLYDVRLPTIETSDLRGLPYYDHETKQTVWYRPEDLPKMGPAVLFLDELSAASPQLQPTVYGLLQERRVGQHKLPDDVMIIAAGNTVEDGAVAFELGTAIADRMIHLYVQASAEDWLNNYAIPANLHPAVTAFIKTRPDLLSNNQECLRAGKMIATTPRSWDRVSQIMQTVSDRRTRNIMIAGTIGDSVHADFLIVADDIAASVQVLEMVKKPRAERVAMYPGTLHGLNALVFGLVGNLSPETLEASMQILLDLRRLDRLRAGEEAFTGLPIKELSVNGFELIFTKAIAAGLDAQIAVSSTYAEYERERAELGLNSVMPVAVAA